MWVSEKQTSVTLEVKNMRKFLREAYGVYTNSKVGQVQFSVCEGKRDSTACLHTPELPQTPWPHLCCFLEQVVLCCPSNHAQTLSGRGLTDIFPKCALELTVT